ncbi:MAG: hypothetical protein U9N83_00210, partial [Thermodesulfobacteriota bacterium]|nr:hypothetical protein [Thermodesulfobacteriota bacterium]
HYRDAMECLSEKNYSSLTTVAELRKRSIKGAVVLVLVAISFALTPTSGMAKSTYSGWLENHVKVKNWQRERILKRCRTIEKDITCRVSIMNEIKTKVLPVWQSVTRRVNERRQTPSLIIDNSGNNVWNETMEKRFFKDIDTALQYNPIIINSPDFLGPPFRVNNYRSLEAIVDNLPEWGEKIRSLKRYLQEQKSELEKIDMSIKRGQDKIKRAERGILLEGDWQFVKPKDSSVIRIYWLPKYEKFFGKLIRISDRLRYDGFPDNHVLWRDIGSIRSRTYFSAYGEYNNDYKAVEYTYQKGNTRKHYCSLRLSDDGRTLWYKSRHQTLTLKRKRVD